MLRRNSHVPVCPPTMFARAAVVAVLAVGFIAAVVHFTHAADLALPQMAGPLLDQGATLLEPDRNRIAARLNEIHTQTGATVAVAIVKDLQGQPAPQYARTLFDAWKMGDGPGSKAVLLLVAPGQHQVSVASSPALDGIFTAQVDMRIIFGNIVPAFEDADQAKGIWDGITAIGNALQADPAALQAEAKDWAARRDAAKGSDDTVTLVIGALAGLALAWFAGSKLLLPWLGRRRAAAPKPGNGLPAGPLPK